MHEGVAGLCNQSLHTIIAHGSMQIFQRDIQPALQSRHHGHAGLWYCHNIFTISPKWGVPSTASAQTNLRAAPNMITLPLGEGDGWV